MHVVLQSYTITSKHIIRIESLNFAHPQSRVYPVEPIRESFQFKMFVFGILSLLLLFIVARFRKSSQFVIQHNGIRMAT